MKTLLLSLGVLSLIPIWRDPCYESGLNFWQYLSHNFQSEHPHIPYEEAVQEAQAAYLESLEND